MVKGLLGWLTGVLTSFIENYVIWIIVFILSQRNFTLIWKMIRAYRE